MESFQEINLIEPLQKSLADQNYAKPTPIQAQTIPAAISGHDILGSAQTGTGKTAAFALPVLNWLGQRNRKAKSKKPFALLLAPTRELAIQIGESIAKYGKHLRLKQALVYGGVSQRGQTRVLTRGAHILVATPGRLLDLMNQGFIDLSALEVFVLDEADRMLDMGFLPDLKKIIAALPASRQSLFFSATISPTIVELSGRLLHDPVSVNVTPEKPSVKAIQQKVIFVEKGGKNSTLQRLLNEDEINKALVFTKTKRTANALAERLVKKGFRATAIHGNKSQNARQRALESFRNRKVRILVATDVASRGIDVEGVSHVFNYDLPDEAENYIHRIGRTGRNGAEGTAISLCSGAERKMLRNIERAIGQRVPLAADQPPEKSRSKPASEKTDSVQPRRKKRRKPNRPGKAERAAKAEQNKPETPKTKPKKSRHQKTTGKPPKKGGTNSNARTRRRKTKNAKAGSR